MKPFDRRQFFTAEEGVLRSPLHSMNYLVFLDH